MKPIWVVLFLIGEAVYLAVVLWPWKPTNSGGIVYAEKSTLPVSEGNDPNAVLVMDDDLVLVDVTIEGDVMSGVTLTDDAIRCLAESGRICEVMGHQWSWPEVGYSGSIRCGLCGVVRVDNVDCFAERCAGGQQ